MSNETKEFPCHPDVAHAGKHVATLAVHGYRPGRGAVPTSQELTASVTFLEINGKTYAVTAAHVIDVLNNEAKKLGVLEGSFSAPKDPGVLLDGPYIVPPRDLAARKAPDVALRPIPSDAPGRIGKAAFVVLEENCAPEAITHGIAVGFPTGAKSDIQNDRGTYSEMKGVHAIAQHAHSSADQISFRSDLAAFPDTDSLSGMSGGAVFWSDESGYGLAGIVVEAIDAGPSEPIFNVPMVQFIAQRVDYQTLIAWAEYADEKWPLERKKINDALIAEQLSPSGTDESE